jgi:hypothetical protein
MNPGSPKPELRSTCECALCGTRLRPSEASSAIDADGELLTTVAQHRCAPRVRVRDDESIVVGSRVDVRGRFLRTWSGGFQVTHANASGYWLRRTSDASALPSPFAPRDVRRSG